MNLKFCVIALLWLAVSGHASADNQPNQRGALSSMLKGLSAPTAPVDPEQAFVISAAMLTSSELTVRFEIDECCYLYRGKIQIELVPPTPSTVRLGAYQLPPGKAKADEFLGPTEIYDRSFDLRIPLSGAADNGNIAVRVGYQGCAETPIAICYPPTTKTIAVGEAGNSPGSANTTDEPKTLLAYLVAAFGFGLLLTFTPCVLPMVPILSSLVVGATDRNFSKLEGGLLSYSYVLGTAVTYTIAGAIAGASGSHLQSYFQNPWAIGFFAAVLAALALSMFGFYKLQVPSAIQSFFHHHSHRLHHRSRHVPGGTYVGVFVLGLFSALIIGACASPILIGALAAAMTTRDPILGGAVMFILAHGQGVLLVALGIGAGAILPRVGPWMESVKHVFGALLIAVAIYLLGAVPGVPVLLLWGTFLIVCGVYLRALRRLAPGWRHFWKGFGAVFFLWGAAALLGGFAGNRDLLQPLTGVISVGTDGRGASESKPDKRLYQLATLEQALAQAKTAKRPVLIDYYADWCTDCVRMEGTTFQDSQVRQELRRFVVLQPDVTLSNDPETDAMKKRFAVYAPPALIFIDASGQERRELRAYGYRSATELLALLRKI